MDNKAIQMNEKEIAKLCVKILTDDTHWDLMTGSVLRKRLKAYTDDSTDTAKLVSAMNCLRLTELVYLYKKEGDSTTMPIVPVPDGATMMLFTDKRRITQANLKEFKTEKALLPEIMECFASDELKFIVVNPCDDSFILPVETVKEVFGIIEKIIAEIDADKQKGIDASDLTDLMFERFGGCTVEIDTKDGRHIVGDAFSYCKNEKGQCLTIDITETEKVDVYKEEVKRIKDITKWEE